MTATYILSKQQVADVVTSQQLMAFFSGLFFK